MAFDQIHRDVPDFSARLAAGLTDMSMRLLLRHTVNAPQNRLRTVGKSPLLYFVYFEFLASFSRTRPAGSGLNTPSHMAGDRLDII